MYLMRIQELGSNTITVVEAEGTITAIIQQLALLNIHVINYVSMDKGDEIVVIK
jgi:hypothetical protein